MTQNDHQDSEDPTIGPGEGVESASGEASSLHEMPTQAEPGDVLAGVGSSSAGFDSESPTMVPLGASGIGGAGFERSVPGYMIRRVLGQGGMGAVYFAEQEKPRRMVALKVIRPDRVSEATLKRFEYEAQLLASLAHPGIASVYEVGAFDFDGHETPYFAMEYIAGAKSITEFARDEGLSVRDRLVLFEKVCSAVQHGHQRGVIHRDLKPANILVDEHGEPRVIDFGVARGDASHRAAVTMETDAGQIVGTLQYMSPEQCTGTGVDVRSDVYALGAVLYQLLSGELPYDIREMSLAHAITVVTDSSVRPLSAVTPTLRGDLTVITGKALEKDTSARYQSVSEFAGDIRRSLADQPILARPMGPVGLLGKWVKRNRELSVAIGAAAVLLITTSTVLVGRIVAAERKATANLRLAEQNLAASEESVALVRKMLEFRAPDGESRIRGGMVDVESLLDDAAASIGASPPELPETEAAFRELLGTGYVSLLSLEKAKSQLSRVLEVRRDEEPSDELAETMHELARAHFWAGEYDAALPLYTEALAIRRALHPGDHPRTAFGLTHLAATKLRLGDARNAGRLYEEALAMRRRLLGDQHPDVAASLNNIGNFRAEIGDLAGAERALRASLEMISRLKPGESLEVSHATNNLARVLARRGAHEESAAMFRRALAIREARLKPGDARVWASRTGLALALMEDLGGHGEGGVLRDLEIRVEGTPAQRAGALIEIAGMLVEGERWGDAASMLDGAFTISDEQRDIRIPASAFILRSACALGLDDLTNAEWMLGQARKHALHGRDAEAYDAALDDLVGRLELAGRRMDAVRCSALRLGGDGAWGGEISDGDASP